MQIMEVEKKRDEDGDTDDKKLSKDEDKEK